MIPFLEHPDVPRNWTPWSEQQTLHVAASYSNPFRWRTRRTLANDFRRHMRQSANVELHFGELAYGDRPHEVTGDDRQDVQLRTQCELFHKENHLNRIIQQFPPNWQYGAIVDSDFHFTRHDWALEAIHQLQHYDFVQLFSSYADLTGADYASGNYGGGYQPMGFRPGFAYNYIARGCTLPEGYSNGGWKTGAPVAEDPYYGAMAGPAGIRAVGATGGAWAFRRSALDTVGGLLEVCILGHGDWFMAFGLIGERAPDMRIGGYSADYREHILAWQANAAKLKRNIGYVAGFAIHHFHGSKLRRAYSSRDQILVKHQFSPSRDLRRDWQGIFQLSGDKPALRDAIRAYFTSRTEDDPNLYGAEKPLIGKDS